MTAVTIRGLISTTRLRAGDEVTVEYTDSIADLERAGYVEVLDRLKVSATEAAAAMRELAGGGSDNPEKPFQGDVTPTGEDDPEKTEDPQPAPKRSPRKRAPRKLKTDG